MNEWNGGRNGEIVKRLVFVNGTMGVGKTETCRHLKMLLTPSVFLDGDWCWDMEPFVVNDDTKSMVIDNISHLLNAFLACSGFENVVFCWVMHERSIVDEILKRIDSSRYDKFFLFTLVASEEALNARLRKDIADGKRKTDVIDRSLERATHYRFMNSIKVDVTDITAEEAARRIVNAVNGGETV